MSQLWLGKETPKQQSTEISDSKSPSIAKEENVNGMKLLQSFQCTPVPYHQVSDFYYGTFIMNL